MSDKLTISSLTEIAAKEDAEKLSRKVRSNIIIMCGALLNRDTLTDLTDRFRDYIGEMYSYLQSDYNWPSIEDMTLVRKIVDSLSLVIFTSLVGINNIDFSQLDSTIPRLSYALRLGNKRLAIEEQLRDNAEAFLTIQDLADFAGVTYTAVKKQLNVTISARKKNGIWDIPADAAAQYIQQKRRG